eukprot:CAMPEP_0194131988 /NCGR_PEP_ID=MMETSP0152-20130528/2574_1 /TAXON_ID=1049557 /ORGANISM="Thalassiothrix antarctica, Strain L6-D1" /LENGTH=292 /DNA_ID=CAMNT_0038826889 /DNA_START=29 /DNA_END=907 /DNA_ORIENTATION=+
MSLKKIGEKVVRKALETLRAVTAAEAPIIQPEKLKTVGEKVVRKALETPRAVTAAEAPFIKPEKESTKVTLMPWKGWMGRLLKKAMGEERYKTVQRIILYKPDDIHDMNQMPIPNTKVHYALKDPTLYRQFRNPSPGSEPGTIRIPKADEDCTTADPYDNSYYTRDTARRYLDTANLNNDLQKIKLALMNPNSTEVQEMQENIKPESSPGNKGVFATGKSDFDETGLRAAMSSNHEALDQSLDDNMPDHLPYPCWYYDQDKHLEWYKERDLPVPVGVTGFGTVPVSRRVARW